MCVVQKIHSHAFTALSRRRSTRAGRRPVELDTSALGPSRHASRHTPGARACARRWGRPSFTPHPNRWLWPPLSRRTVALPRARAVDGTRARAARPLAESCGAHGRTRPFPSGSSTNPPLSLFSSRVVWSYGKKFFYEFAVEIPHAPHPQANQRNPRAMRPLTPAHRRPLALWLVCRAERPARVAARDPRARSPARRRPVDRHERGTPGAQNRVPIGTAHHESARQRKSAL